MINQHNIVICGAREHNLKNINAEIPNDKLVVFTGLSGSGKSTLAFDTIYAEGQRRYMESLSSYARQFLGQLSKPKVDFIDGLSPAISIDQKSAGNNPRSTVGTVTEIYDYLRLLYARTGLMRCPNCGRPVSRPASRHFTCPECGASIGKLSAGMFSFNTPQGACPKCGGLGYAQHMDESLMIKDDKLTLRQGGIVTLFDNDDWFFHHIESVAAKHHFSLDVPVCRLPRWVLDEIFYGCGDEMFPVTYYDPDGGRERTWLHHWEGLVGNFQRRYRTNKSESVREQYEKYMISRPCDACHGARLKPESLAVTVGGATIYELCRMNVKDAHRFLSELKLTERENIVARPVLQEAAERLGFLSNVGLDYLTLARGTSTLSGGEAQRIRLATQIGSHLRGVLYVLDEPSTGLHQRDTVRLINALKELRDRGNTVLVVEHDEEMMRAADFLVDIGPGAGESGGHVVASGPLESIIACKDSITGKYLSGEKSIEIPQSRRPGDGRRLIVKGAAANNLKHIDVAFPLGLFICVTGVSGSGKSSLVNEILYKACARKLNRAYTIPGPHDSIEGMEHLEKVIMIDQSPIGRTPRSNPATYTGLFNDIRELYSKTPDAKARGYKQGRFSFNARGGRCEACEGDGIIKINMHFLPDVFVPCEVCSGRRYNQETLEICYRGRNIADVLDMTVDDAADFFEDIPKLSRKLETLKEVGLGYISLGQSATTLSGGEAQRVKLAGELARISNGRSLYILDEPTNGLHTDDIKRLLTVLNRLVEAGDTVVVIEHNLHVIKTADYIIDLGPEGGEAGGHLTACGTPEEVAESPLSHTGKYLKRMLR